MDAIRYSLSRLKKKIKRKLRTDADGSQDRLAAQPPRPGSVPAGGSDDGRPMREGYIDGREISQRYSRLDPDVEIVMESRRSGEIERVNPSPYAPPIPHGGEPDSASTWLS